MDFFEAANARRSVRNYQNTPVPDEKLAHIWEAVRQAPSACNLQPWRFLVIKTPAMRDKLRTVLQSWVFTAPVLIVALGNRDAAWRRDGQSYHEIDVAIANEHLCLAAAAEGLGTCWICAFDRRAMKWALGLEPEWDPVAVTPLGFADDPNPRTLRKAIEEIVREV